MHIGYKYKELNPKPSQRWTKSLPMDYTVKGVKILTSFYFTCIFHIIKWLDLSDK
jgi:hypothetical protein